MHADTRSAADHAVSATTHRLAAPLAAAMLGLVVLYGVGFLPVAAAHNAAHDTRHAAAFPCH